jgi:hypothetical protein
MDQLLQWALRFVRGTVTALLPSPEREAYARRHGLDAPWCSFLFGFAQGGVGVALFVVRGLAFMRAISGDLSVTLLENWDPSLSTTHFRGTGLIGWLSWLVWPGSWPWTYLAVVGLVRCLTFAITREAIGEPVLIPAYRAIQRREARKAALRRAEELGPMRPDRIEREGEETVVIGCREKPGWETGTTVEIQGRYFRITGAEERFDGRWVWLAYRLREAEETAAIRRMVRYRPADSALRQLGMIEPDQDNPAAPEKAAPK